MNGQHTIMQRINTVSAGRKTIIFCHTLKKLRITRTLWMALYAITFEEVFHAEIDYALCPAFAKIPYPEIETS